MKHTKHPTSLLLVNWKFHPPSQIFTRRELKYVFYFISVKAEGFKLDKKS